MLLVSVGVVLAALLSFVNCQHRDAAADERKRRVLREMFDDSSARAHWKDPYDMFGNVESPSSGETMTIVDDDEEPVNDEFPRKDDNKRADEENPKQKRDEPPPAMRREPEADTCVPREMVFLSRWLKIVYSKLSRRSFFDVGDSKIVSFKVTKTKVAQMKKILDTDAVNFKDMEDLLTDSLSDLWVMDEVSWLSKLYDVVFVLSGSTLVPIFAVVLFLYALSRASFVKKLVVVFVCACAWNWMRLYKEAIAVQHARLERTDVPAACFQKDFGLWFNIKAYLKSWIYDSGDCTEYYKSLMVDPIFNIDPSKAVVDTMCNIIFIPLERIGYYMNRFVKNLLFELSLEGKIVAVMIFIIFLLLFFNYSIRLPWFLGVIEPSRNSRNIMRSLAQFSTVAGVTEEKPVQHITQGSSDNNKVSMHKNPLNQINESQHNSHELIRLNENEHSRSDQSIVDSQNSNKQIKIINESSKILPNVSMMSEKTVSTMNTSEIKNESPAITNNSEMLSSPTGHKKTILPKSVPIQNCKECLHDRLVSLESNRVDESINTNLLIVNKETDASASFDEKKFRDLLKIKEE